MHATAVLLPRRKPLNRDDSRCQREDVRVTSHACGAEAGSALRWTGMLRDSRRSGESVRTAGVLRWPAAIPVAIVESLQSLRPAHAPPPMRRWGCAAARAAPSDGTGLC